ncbi:hypothetical protein M426DRAFT_316908 [Hypoxylon sp. CI-4A]|nr:hypothetical protein M426DRAFT_316908 [Hypoxylon sp. CI-4A]
MAEQQPITIEDAKGTLSVTFSEATTPEGRTRCSELASTAFGKSLSKVGYMEREAYLADQPLARGTGWRFWCLTLADDPRQVLAMCKTLHRDLLVRDGEKTTPRWEQAYCICSVITDSRYRGRGLASVMLKRVAEWMDGPGDGAASVLYSDVGEFYVSKGWDVLDAFQSTLTVPTTIPSLEGQFKFPETRPIIADEIPSLCERDVKSIKADFERYDLPPGNALVTFLPTTNIIQWLHSRISFMNRKLLGKSPETKGSICESADAWLYWYHDLHHQKLTIQRVKLPRDQSEETTTRVLARLFLDTLEEAAKWDIEKVVVWNPAPEIRKALTLLNEELGIDVVSEKRENTQIPCLRIRGGGKKPLTVWTNEYFSWS